jgi:hypothetical protein
VSGYIAIADIVDRLLRPVKGLPHRKNRARRSGAAVRPMKRRGQEPDHRECLVIPGCSPISPRVQRIGDQLGGQRLDNLLAGRAHLPLGQKVGNHRTVAKLVQRPLAILAGEPEIINATTSRDGQSVGRVRQEDPNPVEPMGSPR